MIDGFGLMKESDIAARASGHCASKRGIESKLIQGLSSAERAVRLIEWLLGKKERTVKFGFESPDVCLGCVMTTRAIMAKTCLTKKPIRDRDPSRFPGIFCRF